MLWQTLSPPSPLKWENEVSNSKNPLKRRAWTESRRKTQAERAQKQQPWRHSTGPKTPEGKAKSAANAHKTGLHTAQIRKLRAVLRAHKAFLKEIAGNTRWETKPYPSCLPRESGDLLPSTRADSRLRGKSRKVLEEEAQKRGKLHKRRSTRTAKHGGVSTV